jgi:putative FmdB family regulatory protein|tara:strand:+ start:2451 stop:2804 length:354 start_codon:yes stop_codon:yes gene_type:complete
MPTYDYLCNDCGCEFERIHGFGKTPDPCECGSSNIKIVINQAPAAFVKGEPTTLGQLAEANTKNMGRYELEDKRAYQEAGKQKPKKEWWQKSGNASSADINKMSKAQKAKYIRDGDK